MSRMPRITRETSMNSFLKSPRQSIQENIVVVLLIQRQMKIAEYYKVCPSLCVSM